MTIENSVDADQIEHSLRVEAAKELIEKTDKSGWLEINDSGAFLHSRDSIQVDQADWHEEDECKNFDFSIAPYWLTGAGEPMAIYGPQDDDLLCMLDIDEDELEAAIRLAEAEQRREALSEVSKASRPVNNLASPDEYMARKNRGRGRCM